MADQIEESTLRVGLLHYSISFLSSIKVPLIGAISALQQYKHRSQKSTTQPKVN